MKKAIIFYSGGKDSHYVLYKLIKSGYNIPFLLNLEPIPHSDGLLYFNSPYNKKLIQEHSKLMGIEIFYFKQDRKMGSIFNENQEVFFENLITVLKTKIDDFTLFWANDRSNMYEDRKKIIAIKNVLIKRKIKIVFPLEKKDLRDIILESTNCGIKSICVGMEVPRFFNLVGKVIDKNFLNSIDNNIKGEHIQSFVIESPLFGGKKIEPLVFKKEVNNKGFFLRILKYKVSSEFI